MAACAWILCRLFILALLVANGAGCLAGGLAGSLAFAASLVLGVTEVSFFDDLYVFHDDLLFYIQIGNC